MAVNLRTSFHTLYFLDVYHNRDKDQDSPSLLGVVSLMPRSLAANAQSASDVMYSAHQPEVLSSNIGARVGMTVGVNESCWVVFDGAKVGADVRTA